MDNFSFNMPTRIVFGRDTETEVGRLVARYGGTRVLVLFGGGSVVRSGLLKRVFASLDRALLDHVELGGVQPNPRASMVYEGISLVKDEKVDFILAVGGGSVIDTAKAIAAGACYNGDFWDFFDGTREPDEALPVGCILTIAASGSEASVDSVITQDETMLKRDASSEVLRPVFSIMNPELTETLPAYQTACGITDMYSHLLERYLTNTQDVETTDRMIEGVMLAIIDQAPRVMADPADYEARANIMWAACMAHNNVCGVGRSHDWASHEIEYALSSKYGTAHGAGLAVTMPAVMTYCLDHDVARFARLARNVWGIDETDDRAAALAGIVAQKAFTTSIGMPATLGEVGGCEDDIEELVHETCWGAGRTGRVGGFSPFDEQDVEKIFRLML